MSKKNIAYINKDMLIWAREQTPFSSSINELADRFPKKIDVEKLRKWENGDDLPSISEAKELAKLYKLPFACFFLSDIPNAKVKKYIDRRTFNGTEYNGLSYELWTEINRITSDRDILLDYCDSNEPNKDFIKINKNETVSQISDRIRNYLNMPDFFRNKSTFGNNSFNYFRKSIEDKNIIVAQISKVDINEMKGLSIYEDKFPIIAINNKDYERAKTFSLFHEFAHLVRRSSSLCLINDDERNDEEERICDRIAAETLMPKNIFVEIANGIFENFGEWNEMALIKLADSFGVSVVAAFRRLFDLDLITKDFYIKEYAIINEKFEKTKEIIANKLKEKNVPFYYHVKYINAHGHLLPKIVISAYDNGKLSFGETCTILEIQRKHFDDIARSSMK